MKRKTIRIGKKKLKFYILDQKQFCTPYSDSPCDRCSYQTDPNCDNFKNPMNEEETFSDFCCSIGGNNHTYIPFPGTIENFYSEEKNDSKENFIQKHLRNLTSKKA